MKWRVILNTAAMLVILTTDKKEMPQGNLELETDKYADAMDKFNDLQRKNPTYKPQVDMDDSTDWDEEMTPEKQAAQDEIIAKATKSGDDKKDETDTEVKAEEGK